MAISIAGVGVERNLSRAEVLRDLKADWWQLRRAVDRRHRSQIIPHMDRVDAAMRDHSLTLAELLVASGCVR